MKFVCANLAYDWAGRLDGDTSGLNRRAMSLGRIEGKLKDMMQLRRTFNCLTWAIASAGSSPVPGLGRPVSKCVKPGVGEVIEDAESNPADLSFVPISSDYLHFKSVWLALLGILSTKPLAVGVNRPARIASYA